MSGMKARISETARRLFIDKGIEGVSMRKVADLVVYSGDPFASTTRVQSVLLRGEVVLQR